MDIDQDMEERIKVLADDNDVDLEIAKEKYMDLKEEFEEKKPELNEMQLESVALNRLDGRLSRMASYEEKELVILGKSDKTDRWSGAKREAKEQYEMDRDMATATGITDEDGTPLVTDEMNTDVDVGEPIPTQYLKNVHAVDSEGDIVSITLWGNEQIERLEDIETGDKVEITLVDNGNRGNAKSYSVGVGTSIEKVKSLSESELWDDVIKEKVSDEYIYKIGEARQFIRDTSNLDDYSRVGIIEGYIRRRYLNEDDPDKNGMLQINDANATDEKAGVTAWLSDSVDSVKEYGEDTWVAVIGNVSLGEPYGDQKKKPITINNATSVIAHPELRFEPQSY